MERQLLGTEELLSWEILALPGNHGPQKNEAYFGKPFLQYGRIILEQQMCFCHIVPFKIMCNSLPRQIKHFLFVHCNLDMLEYFMHEVFKIFTVEKFQQLVRNALQVNFFFQWQLPILIQLAMNLFCLAFFKSQKFPNISQMGFNPAVNWDGIHKDT